MNARTASNVAEAGLVLLIAVGITAEWGWPIAAIVFGVLMLIGTQGLTAARREQGDDDAPIR